MAQRARRPFWIHQFAEYLMGGALVSLIFQDPEPMVPVVVGIVMMLSASMVRGPLGAFAAVGRRTHRVVDLAMVVLLVIAAIQPWVPESSTGRFALGLILIPFISNWFYTDWDEIGERRARRVAAGSDRSESVGRRAGRVAGASWRAAKKTARSKAERGEKTSR